MVARRIYVPERGDVVWLDFNQSRGHEQSGKRPALIVSPRAYNEKSGLALACPITSQVKGYPFEVTLRSKALQGVILADQIRAIDWKKRHAKKVGTISDVALADVQEYVRKLLFE